MSVWELVKYFEDYFFKSMDEVDIQRPNIVARATDHVNEQIKLIHKLIEKGFTYQTEQAIYFDISKFPNYTKLSGQKIDEKVVGARETVVTDQNKKHPADFALWLFTVGHFKDHVMRWSTPWGEGFPGWHIECSAMSMEYLGSTIDIHTGATEHIPVHHTNEIAQSEAATGQQFVRFWVHHGLLMVDGKKMSKSLKNFYTLDDVKAKGLDPLALRYLVLTAHYRDQLNFTWESLTSAQNALNNLRSEVRDWSFDSAQDKDGGYYKRFLEALNNDLNTPQALAIMWEMVKSDEPSAKKAATLLQMDKVLGLKLEDYIGKPLEIPQEVQDLVNQREEVRKQGDFKKSDELRHEIKKSGYEVEDTSTGPKIKIS
jgi:cysteinyl-tRNA synthetase